MKTLPIVFALLVMPRKWKYRYGAFALTHRGTCSPAAKRRSQGPDQKQQRENSEAFKLVFWQLNIGSLVPHLAELQLRLDQERPDIVLLEETNLQPPFLSKFCNYHPLHEARTEPRQKGKKLRGGGVSTLVRSDRLDLSFLGLAKYKIEPDKTTEFQRVRCFVQTKQGKHVTVDILHLYIPPIHGGSEDTRVQLFNPDRVFRPAIEEQARLSDSVGLLVAGDVNAHSMSWDAIAKEDDLGVNINDYLEEHPFIVYNSGLPTFHQAGIRSAPDVTFFCGSASIQKWGRLPAIGRTHHDLLHYDLISTDALLRTNPRRRPHKTSISWRKVQWTPFINDVEASLQKYKDSLPDNPSQAFICALSNDITLAFRKASRSLPKGSRPDPVSWITPEVEGLIQDQEESWAQAQALDSKQDWLMYERTAMETQKAIRNAKQHMWKELTSSLDMKDEPKRLMRIIRAIQQGPQPPPNAAQIQGGTNPNHNPLQHPPVTHLLLSSCQRAEAYAQHYKKLCTRTKTPGSCPGHRKANSIHCRLKSKNRTGSGWKAFRESQSKDQDSRLFSMDELTSVVKPLPTNRACGADQIYYEYIKHSSVFLLSLLLYLYNAIWATGFMPLTYLKAEIMPALKQGKDPSLPESYRPVALTSCFSKVLERLVVNRLRWRVEHDNILHSHQSGFCPGRSTLDYLMGFTAEIHAAFEKFQLARPSGTESILHWCNRYNMILSANKCKTILFSNARPRIAPLVWVQGHPLKCCESTRLLGVRFNRRLIFSTQISHIASIAALRTKQLATLANSVYGPTQACLRTVYTIYIRGFIEYGAPVWYPVLSQTQRTKLERIQRKALRIILGVPRCVQSEDLCLEAGVTLLFVRFQLLTAYNAKRLRRYPPNDPLFALAHSDLPPPRLQRHCWQMSCRR